MRPGITVLLDDSIQLIRNRRVGLITNQTGQDEKGRSDIDLLSSDPRAKAAGVRLVTLFSPEHGIRGIEDRAVPNSVDEKTGLPIISLYGNGTAAPTDSTLKDIDVLVFDLQDIGTRTWTFTGVMIYSMRAAMRNRIPYVVLDHPNPITGNHFDGPMLDSAIANPADPSPTRRGLAFALYPFPLRHGMTMGEMARFYSDTLKIAAELHVIPAIGWRRSQWLDETGIPWIHPSPNLPTPESALLYPSLVALEATNISVGRGTPMAHHLFGAPGLDAAKVVTALNERDLAGVTFRTTTFAANNYGKWQQYNRAIVPGVEIVITDRERIQSGRLAAAIIWSLLQTNPSDFQLADSSRFDLLFGSPKGRRALVAGDDPDSVIDRELPEVVRFNQATRRFHLYR